MFAVVYIHRFVLLDFGFYRRQNISLVILSNDNLSDVNLFRSESRRFPAVLLTMNTQRDGQFWYAL